jgi:uncharacterized protein YifE (UPF0438 family)
MGHQGMREVKVRRSDLLGKVKANREKHKSNYEKAIAVYKQEAVEAIQKLLDDAKAGDIRHGVSLVKPEQHLEEYDQAIQMLEMSVDDEVRLDQSEFAQYVMDKWAWARAFENTTMSYASKFRA